MNPHAVETLARALAARSMMLTKTDGSNLPDELWRQCIPDAEALLPVVYSMATRIRESDVWWAAARVARRDANSIMERSHLTDSDAEMEMRRSRAGVAKDLATMFDDRAALAFGKET